MYNLIKDITIESDSGYQVISKDKCFVGVVFISLDFAAKYVVMNVQVKDKNGRHLIYVEAGALVVSADQIVVNNENVNFAGKVVENNQTGAFDALVGDMLSEPKGLVLKLLGEINFADGKLKDYISIK